MALSVARNFLRDRGELAIENLALRQQLAVFEVKKQRPRLRKRDRIFWVWLARVWSTWRSVLVIVQPDAFTSLLKGVGIKVIRIPARSPNLNAYAERFVRTIKESCLDRMIFFGEDALRRSISEFMIHYHHERNHQGVGNRLIDPRDEPGSVEGSLQCRERLGGVLRYYHREAA